MKNLFKARWMTSLIFLIALFVITGIAAPGFLTYDNIVTCFNTATMYTLLAVGIAFVIMTGEIDVSIGATLGLTAGMTGLIAQQDGSIPKMLLLCLATGAAIGLVNGVGVSYFGVPSLIFTLGTNSVVRGLIYIMSGGRTIENFGGAISSYGNKTVFAGVTLYYAIAVVLVAISHLALTKTRKGKYFIAVGDNAGGANLVGVCALRPVRGSGRLRVRLQVRSGDDRGRKRLRDDRHRGLRARRHFALRRLGQRGRRGHRRGDHVLHRPTAGLYRPAVHLQQHHHRHDADRHRRHRRAGAAPLH